MKLTPGMTKDKRAAFIAALPKSDIMSDGDLEAIFLAGCRYQHQITLERAAKVCEHLNITAAGATKPKDIIGCAREGFAFVIRALPYEDE